MESDLGKLFIGGISWDTNEERLKEYFSHYGEVLEAVIMKDRTTGRARGFGFIVFADPAVAERVVMEKHIIDGRMVEAKKAVPRQDQHVLTRNNSPVHGSPGPARTKKIFVGGLASTVTEADFRKYFERFGTITDVVVMYDHNTQRPRGFGFITYDSEDAVDKVLVKTFHELNGKTVEVKRAVPKELSPGPTMKSPIGGYGYNISRIGSFLNNYGQVYNPNLAGGYGMRMDTRLGLISSGRGRLPPFSPIGYGMGMNIEQGFNLSFGGNINESNSLAHGRSLSPFFSANSSKFSAPIDYGGGNLSGSVLSSTTRNMWDNDVLNFNTSSASDTAFLGSGTVNLGGLGSNGVNWGVPNSPLSAQNGRTSPGYASMSLGDSVSENDFGLGNNRFEKRNNSTAASANASFSRSSGGYDGTHADLYSCNSIYGDPTWRSSPLELVGSSTSDYCFGNVALDATIKDSDGYMGGYNVRQ